jgi:hypothetical protein
MKATIYHNTYAIGMLDNILNGHKNEEDKPCGPFWNTCTNCTMKPVAQIEVADQAEVMDLLETIFHGMQNGIGNLNPPQTRSLSVGDVVVLHQDGGDEAWVVASMGFKPTDLADTLRGVDNYKAWSQRENVTLA